MSIGLQSYLELVAIFVILAWGIYINNRNGQLNFGPVYAMGIGAYFSAYAVVDMDWPFGLALIVAVCLGAAAGFLPAPGLARAPVFAVAIATIGFIYIAQAVIRNLAFLGGASGYFFIPKIDYLPAITWIALIVIGFILYRIEKSRIGRAIEISFVDTVVADTLGINRYRLSIFLQTFAGATGALAGVFYAFTMRGLYPTHFGFSLLLRLITFVFVGGCTTMWGVAVFTPVLWAVTVFLPDAISAWRDVIYGALIVIVFMIRPEGVIDRPLIRFITAKAKRLVKQDNSKSITEDSVI